MTQIRREDIIEVKDLEIGAVYQLDARNMFVGMWNGRSFIGKREKFHLVFLDEEIHWDLDDHYGTAQPVALIMETDGTIPS